MNNCNIPENLANRYGLATIGYIYDVNGEEVFNELNDYIKFHNIDYNTDDMFSVYNPSIFLPEYYNKYGYWMMLFKLNNNYSLTPFEKTIYNVKFDNNIDTLRDDYLNKRVYSDPTFNSNVKKGENVNILYRKIENKVYGFITPDNIIYLDKDSLNNPNTMFHEFYHLYDKILVNNSDESTQAYSIITRANELIVESGHLNEVQNDINYKHLSLELQQIEARARMIGDYAENKFSNNKIKSIVNDIIEYIKSLFDKGTFDDYSNDEILKMNIVDFNDIVINEMINNDESIVSKDLNKVLLNKLKSVFKPYYKEVTFDKNKANSIRKEYEKRADIIYLNQVILDNITNNEYNIVEGSNWNLPYDNKLILDLLNSGDIEAINTLTKIIINDNPQLSDINIDNNDLIKYVAYNLNGDDIELLLSLDLNDKEFNDFIIERNKKRIYNNTKHFYISVANNYNKYLEYNKLRNDETFKELYDNIDNNSILTPENSLYLYSIFNKEFKNKKEITQELNKYNIYKNYANSIQAMFIKEIEKNPNLDLNEVANNLFDNNNIKILNDNVNYFESRYPIWTNYVDIIPSTNIKLTNSTLNDILSVYTGELYFNDLLNYKGNISFNLTNILNKRIIDLFETDEMENDYIKNNVVSLVGNEIMNNAKFRNDIQSLFNKSMNKNISYGINFGVNGEYYKGLQNVKDFVTESLTNERFISYLKSLNILEDVYDRIDFYTNINTQTNNLERNKELLQEKYQELIKLDVLLRNVNSDTIVELNGNNLVIDDNIIDLNDVGFRLNDENVDNIIDILNKFVNKVLKEFNEFDLVDNETIETNDVREENEISAERKKQIEELFNSNPELANEVYEVLGFSPQLISRDGQEYFNSPRIRFFVKIADKVRASLPKVKEGFTRLYRGNRPSDLKSNPSFTNSLEGIALPFLMSYNGQLSYVDVPNSDLNKYLQTSGVAKDSEFMVSSDIAKSAIPIDNNIVDKYKKQYPDMLVPVEISLQQKQQAIQIYSSYLDTIFPDSKVKDIVYHGSISKFTSFIKNATKRTASSDGIWFTSSKELAKEYSISEKIVHIGIEYDVIKKLKKENPTKSYKITSGFDADNYSEIIKIHGEEKVNQGVIVEIENLDIVYSSILNIQNLKTIDGRGFNQFVRDKEVKLAISENKDGLIIKDTLDTISNNYDIRADTYTVFEPEQIHILSSKKDLEMFKIFINFTKSEYSKYGDIQQFRDYIMSKNFAAIEEFLVVNNKTDRKC